MEARGHARAEEYGSSSSTVGSSVREEAGKRVYVLDRVRERATGRPARAAPAERAGARAAVAYTRRGSETTMMHLSLPCMHSSE